MALSSVPAGSAEEGQLLVRWRAARLRQAGLAERPAERLARDRTVDIHALLDLVDRGCPPELAARIMAPLDREVDGP